LAILMATLWPWGRLGL